MGRCVYTAGVETHRDQFIEVLSAEEGASNSCLGTYAEPPSYDSQYNRSTYGRNDVFNGHALQARAIRARTIGEHARQMGKDVFEIPPVNAQLSKHYEQPGTCEVASF